MDLDEIKRINKIDMDNGSYPRAKDIDRVLAKTILSGSHIGIINAVIDKTFGWPDPNSEKIEPVKKRKTRERIKYDFFQKYTGMSCPAVSRIVNELIVRNIIKRSSRRPYKYSLNCNVSEWDRCVFRKKFQDANWGQVTYSDKLSNQVITYSGNSKLPNQVTKMSSNSNRNSKIQKPKKLYKITNNVPKEFLELSHLLREKIKENDPNRKIADRQCLDWAKDVRLMVNKDVRSLDEIRELIIWSQEHSFWRANILSMGTLRKQYTKLKLQKEGEETHKKKQEREDPYDLAMWEMEKDSREKDPY